VKYAFLKHRIGSDIVFDIKESVSLEGNSGPYLQYAHARARSIIKKSSVQPAEQLSNLESEERILARKIGEYAEVIDKAISELMPHCICTYLYELAQTFNGFYEKSRVIGDPRESIRLSLVCAYAQVLKDGLELLNIAAPEHI
jgi:arginyl-tRNA synthetase